jgi:5-methyltetrahydropteroyltriglutamate--homocysteine methyltransferase
MILFDDIGSYPLPKGVSLKGLNEAMYQRIVKDVFLQKIRSGVMVPNYPQFRDMIEMFMGPIDDVSSSESPYVVKAEAAKIKELDVLDEVAEEKAAAGGPRLGARVCVTGPIELYLSLFGATAYTDILYALAESVSRFIEDAMSRRFEVVITSIDEPSLGISPNVVFSEDEIIEALCRASSPCRGRNCEVHLHSPLMAELICSVPTLNIIGVESAAHPDYLSLIDKRVLEQMDTFIRAGIARTDILSLVAGINDRLGCNLWTDPAALRAAVFEAESEKVMASRLAHAIRKFGDRVMCAGPDCGLGSWPDQEMAFSLLSSCARAISSETEDN